MAESYFRTQKILMKLVGEKLNALVVVEDGFLERKVRRRLLKNSMTYCVN